MLHIFHPTPVSIRFYYPMYVPNKPITEWLSPSRAEGPKWNIMPSETLRAMWARFLQMGSIDSTLSHAYRA